jgi:hypothetical protein
MSTKLIDPWTKPDPGFEHHTGPSADDGFSPMDARAADLANFLRAELTAHPQRLSSTETITLANGVRAQLSQRSTDEWELAIHLSRDWFRVFTATTRRGVLEAAEDNRSRPC